MQPAGYREICDSERFRRVVETKFGDRVAVRPAGPHDFALLLAMFDDFEPKQAAQSLPPADEEKRRTWVQDITVNTLGIIALDNLGRAVGHACLIDIEPGRRAELEIMVHQELRNRGLGSCMIPLLLELARHFGYRRIWLAVDARNARAVHLYRKSGFRLIGPMDIELEMELEL